MGGLSSLIKKGGRAVAAFSTGGLSEKSVRNKVLKYGPAALMGYMTGGTKGALASAFSAYQQDMQSAEQKAQAEQLANIGLTGIREQNVASAEAAQKQMDFQERMSSTAHQREVEDLRKAGLNPILSGTGGMGSSSPVGATYAPQSEGGAYVSTLLDAVSSLASATQAQANATLSSAQSAYTAGVQTESTRAGILKTESDAAVNSAMISKLDAETQESIARSGKSLADTQSAYALTALLKSQDLGQQETNKILKSNFIVADAEAKKAFTEGKISESAYGKFLMYLERAVKSVPVVNVGR